LVFCAILGFQAGRNLFIDGDGRWRGGYVPAALRGYPFSLVPTTDGRLTLCFDEDSGLLTEPPAGEPFFDLEGAPTQAVEEVLVFLRQTESSRSSAAAICAQLQAAGLVTQWLAKLSLNGAEQAVKGLYCVDAAALHECSGATLKDLQQSGALQAAFCQLLSMQHLHRLGQLEEDRSQLAHPQRDRLEFLGSDGSINFDTLG
jgi:hypothetical protein